VIAPVLNVNPLVAAIDAAVTAAGVPFGDSNRPGDVVAGKPYVVGYCDGGQITDESLRSRDGVTVGCVFHSYGLSPDSVRIGRKALLVAVFGLGGTVVDGWTVHVPVHEAPVPMDRDDNVNPPLYWQTDEVTIRLTK
jgi:dienelactone hydrolase